MCFRQMTCYLFSRCLLLIAERVRERELFSMKSEFSDSVRYRGLSLKSRDEQKKKKKKIDWEFSMVLWACRKYTDIMLDFVILLTSSSSLSFSHSLFFNHLSLPPPAHSHSPLHITNLFAYTGEYAIIYTVRG